MGSLVCTGVDRIDDYQDVTEMDRCDCEEAPTEEYKVQAGHSDNKGG